MEPISAAKMAEADRRAIEELGIPQQTLMENAGLKVFEAVVQLWGHPKKVCAVCGKGNNGGDAKIAAEHFERSGASVVVISSDSSDCVNKLGSALDDSDLVIDGLFGTGLKRDISGSDAELVGMMNELKPDRNNPARQNYRIVSVDIPSGLDADSGEIRGVCVQSDLTVSFHAVKKGMLTSVGINHAGRIVVADIGIPYEPGQFSSSSGASLADHSYVRRSLLFRRSYSNKGDHGRILLVAGSRSMAGAAVMCARAAVRSGAGLVYLSVPAHLQDHVNISVPEAITFSELSSSDMKELKLSAVCAGPGMGLHRKGVIRDLLSSGDNIPVILDADALNIISSDRKAAEKHRCPLIITPHPGEMARLLGTTVAEIQKDRISAAKNAAAYFNAVVVLKGLNTVVCDVSGRCCVVSAGNPSMACGGMGDVLAGIITSFSGQGAELFDAAVSGAFVHGMAGDIVRSIKGETGVAPSDIIEAVPYLIKGCCDGKQKDN